MKLFQFVLLLSLPLAAEKGDGAKFGTRDPRACIPSKPAGKGAPTEASVVDAFRCALERVSAGMIYLVENVKVQVAATGRPYNPNMDTNASDIDVTVPIYAIRGSFTKYQCGISYASGILKNDGQNCNVYEQPAASGSCYKSTFGDWQCGMRDDSNTKQQAKMPPPPK